MHNFSYGHATEWWHLWAACRLYKWNHGTNKHFLKTLVDFLYRAHCHSRLITVLNSPFILYAFQKRALNKSICVLFTRRAMVLAWYERIREAIPYQEAKARNCFQDPSPFKKVACTDVWALALKTGKLVSSFETLSLLISSNFLGPAGPWCKLEPNDPYWVKATGLVIWPGTKLKIMFLVTYWILLKYVHIHEYHLQSQTISPEVRLHRQRFLPSLSNMYD